MICLYLSVKKKFLLRNLSNFFYKTFLHNNALWNFFLPLVSLSAQDIFRGVFTINFLRQLCLSLTCKKSCTNIGYNCKGNSIDIFRAFSSRDVDMICENWHTHLNCTLGAHCSSCKAAGRILHFCKPLQFMKRSIYVLVVEDQKSINDMHDYTLKFI